MVKNNSKTSFYRIRPFPGHIDRFQFFSQNNLIALGWSKLGDVRPLTREQIYQKLQEMYPTLFKNNARALGLTAGYFIRLKAMQVGDIVLIPYENRIVKIVRVVKPYKFRRGLVAYDMAHVVPTETITQVLSKELAPDLLAAVNSRTTLIALDKYANQIEEIGLRVPWMVDRDDFVFYSGTTAGKKINLGLTKNVRKKDLQDFIDSLDME